MRARAGIDPAPSAPLFIGLTPLTRDITSSRPAAARAYDAGHLQGRTCVCALRTAAH